MASASGDRALLPLAAHTPLWLVLVLVVPLGVGGAVLVAVLTVCYWPQPPSPASFPPRG
ncbi:hypothetical protein [Streptacidiphilus neutrinimicus]|uniref:hypothetical protein n=1 Tax=Streptacidiphilus neutrinimicus TaxID=105420 RepID=UPI000B0AC942|nr:hypothetical protein [Streptacidiphilus neutrinimicus]